MKLFRGGILFLVLAGVPSLAHAQVTAWTGGSGGTFENANNWSNGVPASGVFAIIDSDSFSSQSIITISQGATEQAGALGLGFTYDVATGNTTPGTVTLNSSSSNSTLTVGVADAQPYSLIVTGATFSFAGGTLAAESKPVYVGQTQTVTLSGGGTVNLGGTASMNVTSGTFTFTGINLDIGEAAGSNGTFTQSGNSTVSGGTLSVGDTGGTGTYNLNSGSLTAGVGEMASGANSAGTFNQAGGTSEFTTNLQVGVDGTANFNLNTGTATVDGELDVAVDTNSKGTLTVSSGTTLNVGGPAFVGFNGTGTLQLNGGTTTVTGVLDIGANGTGSGTLNEVTADINANGGMIVGDNANGTFTLTSGTDAVTGDLDLGNNTGITGTLTQNGGILTISGQTTIGNGGTGNFSLNGGASTFTGAATIGTSGGTGTMTLSGGTATFNSAVTVGNTATGTLNLGGSTATFDAGITVDATGTVNQTAGTATVTGGIDLSTVGSSYNLNGGTLNVDTLTGTTGEGTFNFGGGTLQASTAGELADGLDGTVNGNSTLDATNSIINLFGNLTGSGGFTVIGSNYTIMSLSSDATTLAAYTGATVINGGNLALYGGTNGTSVFASPISGTSAGMLTLYSFNPVSTIRLPGTLSFSGTTAINDADYVDVYNGSLGNVTGTNGNLIVGQDGTQGTYGTAATPYPTTGTVSLTGSANTYSGSTQVYNGFTLYASNLATSMTTNNGTFGQNGTVGTTVNFGATYSQPQEATTAAEGSLLVRVGGTVADNYTATAANMYGSVGVTGYSAVGTNGYLIVQTAPSGLTTGTLNSATAAGLAVSQSSSALLSSVLSYNQTTVVTTPPVGNAQLYLLVTQLPLSQFALTPNQAAVAGGLDPAFSSTSGESTLLSALDSLTAAQIPDALDQLSPRSYLDMRNIGFENATFLAEGMHDRMEGMRNGFSGIDTSGLSIVAPGFESNLGRSLGSMLAYNGEGVAPNGVNYYPQDETAPPYAAPASSLTTPDAPARTISDSPNSGMAPTSSMPSSSVFSAPNFGEFISGDLILADLKEDQSQNNIPETHYTAANATAGVGFKITPHLVGGVLFDYNHTDARTDSQGSHVRADTYSPGAFATLSAGGLYLDGLFSFGYNDYSNDRKINIAGNSATATSSPSGQQYVGDFDLGYNFHPDHEGHWALGPEVGLEYVHLDVDSFTESGAGAADLTVNSQSADSLRGRLGGRLSYSTREGSIVFAPTVFASYQHEFLNDPFGLTSQFNIPSSTPFTIQGSNPGRDSALIGIGASATFDNSMAIYLNYLAEIGASDYFIQSVQGGFKASF
jgi:uncharacterized protein with beta-barrel porin domain